MKSNAKKQVRLKRTLGIEETEEKTRDRRD